MTNPDLTQPDSNRTEPAVATLLPREIPAHIPSLSKCRVREDVRWRVRWHESGRIKRKFFCGRETAEAFIARLRGEAITARTRLAALPQDEQETLWRAYTIAREKSLNLVDLLALAEHQPQTGPGPGIKAVLTEMLAAKRHAGRATKYVKNLEIVLGGFAKGREHQAINQVTLQEIERFLAAHNARYWPTLRARLSNLFNFAIRRGYRPDNPCTRLETVNIPPGTPAIITLEEIKICLDWFKANPRSMAWFVLSAFAGLRPEEAAKTTWPMINFEEGWIRVEAQTSKVRQRRVVYPLPMALDWLRLAKKLDSRLPIRISKLIDDRNKLKRRLGWNTWKKDCTRHSAASYWLAQSNSVSPVATAFGHSEGTLKSHYMALVTKAEAEQFWRLLPEIQKKKKLLAKKLGKKKGAKTKPRIAPTRNGR